MKKSFCGNAIMTPIYAKCDPIKLSGNFEYIEETNRYLCTNMSPHNYEGMYINADIIKEVKNG